MLNPKDHGFLNLSRRMGSISSLRWSLKKERFGKVENESLKMLETKYARLFFRCGN